MRHSGASLRPPSDLAVLDGRPDRGALDPAYGSFHLEFPAPPLNVGGQTGQQVVAFDQRSGVVRHDGSTPLDYLLPTVTGENRRELSVPQAPRGGIGAPTGIVTPAPPDSAMPVGENSQPPATTPRSSIANARKFWDIPAVIRAQQDRDFLSGMA